MAQAEARARPSVLIVDDEADILTALGALLESEGFVVSVADNGLDALEQARRRPPDVVLLDVMMPLMDGRALCRALRADPLTAQVPVIFMTAGAPPAQADFGHQAVVRKPFDVDDLVALLRRWGDAATGRAGR